LWSRILTEWAKSPLGQCRSLDCSHVKVHRDGANPAGARPGKAGAGPKVDSTPRSPPWLTR
jgi:hypothetical protein